MPIAEELVRELPEQVEKLFYARRTEGNPIGLAWEHGYGFFASAVHTTDVYKATEREDLRELAKEFELTLRSKLTRAHPDLPVTVNVNVRQGRRFELSLIVKTKTGAEGV